MTTSLSYRWTHDVTPLRLFQIRNRLEYLREKGRRLDQFDFHVLELRMRQERFRCVEQMQLEVVLPEWARFTFLRPRNTVTQHEIWRPAEADGTRVCDITVQVRGVPAEITGLGVVSPVGFSSCTYALTLEISSRMPVFGRRLEEFVATQVDRNAAAEGAFSSWWLENVHGTGLNSAAAW
jgi:hypothetical protein